MNDATGLSIYIAVLSVGYLVIAALTTWAIDFRVVRGRWPWER